MPKPPLPPSNKLLYLGGVRGVSALMVILFHYGIAFYPALSAGNRRVSHLNGAEYLFFNSPLVFLNNGLWFVDVFFVLSGYVLSRQFYIYGDRRQLVLSAVRRFPRLFLPVAASLVLAYVLLTAGLYFNQAAAGITGSEWFLETNGSRGLHHFGAALVYGTMFRGNALYNSALWTITIEFLGSLLVFATLGLFGRSRFRLWGYAAAIIALILARLPLYAVIMMGVLLNATEVPGVQSLVKRRVVLLPLFLLGLFLGGMPPVGEKGAASWAGTFYDKLNFEWLTSRVILLNAAGAWLIIFSAQSSGSLRRFFSSRPAVFLGRISFSLYLIHMLILHSFSSWLFLILYPHTGYNLSFLIVLAASLLIMLPASLWMAKQVDEKAVQFSHHLSKRFSSVLK